MEKKSSTDLSEVDRNILRLMQQDVSLSMAEIAQRAGLSQSACWRRISRFEQEGVIVGKVAMLNPDKLDLGMVVFANIRLSSHPDIPIYDYDKEPKKLLGTRAKELKITIHPRDPKQSLQFHRGIELSGSLKGCSLAIHDDKGKVLHQVPK